MDNTKLIVETLPNKDKNQMILKKHSKEVKA